MARVVEEMPGLFLVYSDGSVARPDMHVPASQQFVGGVATKDIILDPSSAVQARVFLPESTHNSDPHKKKLLPVVMHFHGGGFCFGSDTSYVFHNFLVRFALEANAICIGVDYRLAPEHRLPVAYEDCFAAVKWIQSEARQQAILGEEGGDPWLQAHADFNRCFLAGESAGGNIVHNLAVRISGEDVSPLGIEGLLIIEPFFFGMEKTQSEMEVRPGAFLSQCMAELFWELALPVGAGRDYPPCNPIGPSSPSLSEILFARILVTVATEDMLRDPGIQYYEALKQHGKDVQLVVSQSVDHAYHLREPDSKQVSFLMKQLVDFINGQTA